MARPVTADTPGFVIGRDAGAVGRLLRLLSGALLTAGAALALALAVGRNTAFVLGVLVYLVAQTAAHVAMVGLLADRVLARVDPWVATFILYLPSIATGVLGALGVHILASVAVIGSSLYLGIGLVVMGVTGYGGCELISVANLVLRRRQLMYCPFNAVDLAERAVRADPRRTLALAAGAVALAFGGAILVLSQAGLLSAHVRLPSLDRRWALVLLAPAAWFAAAAALRAARAGWRLDGVARAGALGAAALALAAGGLSGAAPQRVVWPLILFGATIVAVARTVVSSRRRGAARPPA
jgi:hypothetical protein